MRNIILTIAALALSAALFAQGVFSNRTQSVLEKVIQDYPNRFRNIKGEAIPQTRKNAEYRSTLQLPGASSSVIVLASNTTNGSHELGDSWTCTLSELPDFDQARTRYAEIFRQLSNSIIRNNAQKTFILTGQYEEPDRSRKLTRVQFGLLPAVGDLKRLRVELLLWQDGDIWKTALSVNDLDNREDSQGAITAN